jgi:hypothetical protein
MNKYSIRLPYSYIQYGNLNGFVYAESEEEAEELGRDRMNIRDDEYKDSEGDSTEYSYDSIDVELEEENVTDIPQSVLAAIANQTSANSYINKQPAYYLIEVNKI